jgi:hypothetical protein
MSAESKEPRSRAPSVFERHPRPTLAVLLIVGAVLADFGFTFAYSIFRPDFYRDRSVFRERSEIFHHGFKPMVSVDDERWGPLVGSYRINSLGFRDKQVRVVPLSSPNRRVLLIGDSFVEGIGVAYEKTFACLAEEALAPKGIEVLNAGVASFSPIMYLRRTRNLVEEVGLRFDHLVVFIDIGDIQDEVTYAFDAQGNVISKEKRRLKEERANRTHGRPFLLRSLPVRRFLDRHTLLLARAWALADALLTRGPRRAAVWTVEETAMEEYGREGLLKARENMSALHELLSRHRIALSVAVYPWPDQVLLGDRESRQVSFWRAWATERGVPLLDYFPAFVGVGEPKAVVRRYFIPGDIHWNEVGHRLIADALIAHLAPQ